MTVPAHERWGWADILRLLACVWLIGLMVGVPLGLLIGLAL